MGDMYADGAETDSFLDNGELSVVVTAPLCPGDASKAIRNGNATAMLKNTCVRSVAPTPAVSYSVCRPNTCRQLQCLSSQHLASATVSVVPTPAVSYSVSPRKTCLQLSVCRPNTRCQLQCLSSQHTPSAEVFFVPTPAVNYRVCRPNTRRQLQCLSSQHLPIDTV